MRSAPIVRGALTVVETVYHQPPEGQGTAVNVRFARVLDSADLPLQRKLILNESWQEIDPSWLTSVSQLLIVNDEGRFTRIPTKEELAATQAKVVEVGFLTFDDPFAEIPPLESARFCPKGVIKLRCPAGAKCTVTIIPG